MPARSARRVVLAALLVAGCAPDEPIRSYDLSKPADYKSSRPAQAADYRLVGAMFPADDPVWFFKFSGKADQIAKYEAEFDKVISSVRMNPDKDGEPQLPSFTTPADWVRTGRRVVRRMGIALPIEETLRFGPPEDPFEVTITQSGGGLAQNVGRWADQVGYRYSKSEELTKVTRHVTADGVKGVRVDVAGPKNPSAPRGPMMGMGQ